MCGGSYIIVDARSYGCATHKDRGEAACPNNLRVSRKLLENRFLAVIKHHLFKPEGIECFREEMAKVLADKKKQKHFSTEDLRKRLVETEAEIANIMRAIKAGVLTTTTKTELKKAETQKAELSKQLATKDFNTDNVATMLPRAVDRFQAMVNDFENVSQMEVSQIRSKIRAMLDGKITLKPDDTGQLEATVRGDYLGLMQAIDINHKISLVAGERFRTYFVCISLDPKIDNFIIKNIILSEAKRCF